MKRRGRVCVQAGGDEVGLWPVAPRVAAPPWTGKLSGSQVPGAKPPPPLASRAAVRAGEAGEAAARARSPGKRPCALCSPVLMALARPGRNACSAPDAGPACSPGRRAATGRPRSTHGRPRWLPRLPWKEGKRRAGRALRPYTLRLESQGLAAADPAQPSRVPLTPRPLRQLPERHATNPKRGEFCKHSPVVFKRCRGDGRLTGEVHKWGEANATRRRGRARALAARLGTLERGP